MDVRIYKVWIYLPTLVIAQFRDYGTDRGTGGRVTYIQYVSPFSLLVISGLGVNSPVGKPDAKTSLHKIANVHRANNSPYPV
jgi:hypothetical protein